MIFTFLGTSAGRPTKDRNVSALAMEIENRIGWYLFDCGEATQHQLLKTTLSLFGLRAVFITHLHGDHIFGLFGLITSRAMDGCTAPLCIYGPEGLEEIIAAAIDISEEHLGYELRFETIHGGFKKEFDPFYVEMLPLIHSIQSYAFLIEVKPTYTIDAKRLSEEGLPPSPAYAALKNGQTVEIAGKVYKPDDYVHQTPGHRLIIAGDNAEPEILCHYLQDLDLLIHEATYDQIAYDRLPRPYLHTTAKKLALSAQRHGVKNLVATHISPRYNDDASPIAEEIGRFYGGNFYVAKDLDRYILKEGVIRPF